jgi:hypothetical protein
MKIVSRFALPAVATAGLFFATSAPAEAVGDHKHCLYTRRRRDMSLSLKASQKRHRMNPRSTISTSSYTGACRLKN